MQLQGANLVHHPVTLSGTVGVNASVSPQNIVVVTTNAGVGVMDVAGKYASARPTGTEGNL